MKKIMFSGTLVVAFLTMMFFAPPVFAKTITLKYANFFPPTHSQSITAEAWCKAVEKATQGRVKIEYFPGGSLLNGKQMYDGVESGIADIGMSVLAYTSGRFPVMSAMDLPFGYPSGVVATKVANEVYATLKPKDFKDTHLMYLTAHGPGIIHTTKKEVKTLEDLKGLRIRATGMSAKMVQALGATPVTMTMGNAYEALAKGVVDGSANPMEALHGWKLGEVLNYTTRCYSVAYTTTFFVTMNKAKWDSLEPQDQKAIEKLNSEWQVKHGEAWDQSDKVAYDEFVKAGKTVVDLTPAESKRWKAAVAPVIKEYADGLSQKGLDGPKVIKTIETLLEKAESK